MAGGFLPLLRLRGARIWTGPPSLPKFFVIATKTFPSSNKIILHYFIFPVGSAEFLRFGVGCFALYFFLFIVMALRTFFLASTSPMSHHAPSSGSCLRKRPGGSRPRTASTTSAVMWAFSVLDMAVR